MTGNGSHDRAELIQRTILESMSDGVVTITFDGRITSVNPAAAAMLGIDDVAGVAGRPFAEVMFELSENDAFVDAVLDRIGPDQRHDGQQQVVPYRRLDGSQRLLALSVSDLAATEAGQRRRIGVVCVLSDVTETEALRQAERALAEKLEGQNRQLIDAYKELETGKQALEATAKRIQVWRLAATGVAFLLFAGSAAYVWSAGGSGLVEEASPTVAEGPAEGITVQPRLLRKSVRMVGSIEPGTLEHVTAPFAGLIRERSFEYGTRVKQGDLLLVLAAGELEVQRREADAAVIKATQALEDLKGWSRSADVARARRAVARSEQQLQAAKQKLEETRRLFELGVVPRQEVESLEDQAREATNALTTSQEELDSVLRKGEVQAVRIAENELTNARYKLDGINRRLAGAEVRAPRDGVVLRPPKTGGSGEGAVAARDIETGAKVNEGDIMFAVGSLDSLRITTPMSEVDVGAVSAGQPVRVTSPAFPGITLDGEVVAIANQAEQRQGAGLPSFPVTVLIESMPAAAAGQVRLGMSAELEIVTYEKPDALLLPPSAIQPGSEGYSVRRRNPQTGAAETVKVAIGQRFPEGVEIVSGMAPGDVILP